MLTGLGCHGRWYVLRTRRQALRASSMPQQHQSTSAEPPGLRSQVAARLMPDPSCTPSRSMQTGAT